MNNNVVGALTVLEALLGLSAIVAAIYAGVTGKIQYFLWVPIALAIMLAI